MADRSKSWYDKLSLKDAQEIACIDDALDHIEAAKKALSERREVIRARTSKRRHDEIKREERSLRWRS